MGRRSSDPADARGRVGPGRRRPRQHLARPDPPRAPRRPRTRRRARHADPPAPLCLPRHQSRDLPAHLPRGRQRVADHPALGRDRHRTARLQRPTRADPAALQLSAVAGPERPPASAGSIGLVLGSIASVQLGASFAVLLFPTAGPIGTVTLRLVFSAVVLLVVCRPRLRGHSRSDWGTVTAYGLALGGMNACYYEAIARIPQGAAVTLEVLGPLTLSVIAGRSIASLVWAVLALAGVVTLSQGGFSALDPVGAGFALGAAVLWAAYIVFAGRTGGRFQGIDGLALALAVGAVVSLPFGVASAGSALVLPPVLLLGFAVAVLSSALPYALELLALRRLRSSTFSILMSLAPGAAALSGFLVLGQRLSVVEAVGIALVVAASIGAVRTAQTPT
ncbi:EamA family transporter [Rathayibacter rathayi]|uniref:EamA family transporter n=1 Tax=Rathayibacter rathayi TaxID=33887 RepID=A0ABD6W8R8_RATRA|nr:EamA family transporter [Rathayibacter rathayi]MWV74766.1 EamA family transporter [Rathayibacter rathayi NCPPB 2980 = VKM Ac-1601]PPF14234.1 EamA family transporter [Rathayibacter rathayi]PPF25964.1 EamA family transporter [Rathayibacter rathayi]PPF50593.1 EamA family transporter [Rathayibacter rathayi]